MDVLECGFVRMCVPVCVGVCACVCVLECVFDAQQKCLVLLFRVAKNTALPSAYFTCTKNEGLVQMKIFAIRKICGPKRIRPNKHNTRVQTAK